MYYTDMVIRTLKKEKAAIILFVCGSILMNIYYTILSNVGFKLYPLIINMFFLILYLFYKFFAYRKLYKCLEEGVTSPQYNGGKNSLFEDVIEKEKEIHKKYLSEISKLNDSIKERDLMLIEWIHNMKTSVSVISLATESMKSKEGSDIRYENELLKKNLENVLNVFRMDEFSSDYMPESINLNSIVKEVVNSEKSSFIYGKVYPKNRVNSSLNIYSDKKWLKFVIKQLIINAVKYSEANSSIMIFGEESDSNITLHIKDKGIGIKKSEIHRIFEPFFTGTNGRSSDKSSGMGLYMVKKICDKLHISVDVSSESGKGSDFSLTFRRSENC